MKIRKSFYIRWLLSRGGERQTERSVIDIEHIQSGEARRVSSLEEANEWMKTVNEAQKEVRLFEAE